MLARYGRDLLPFPNSCSWQVLQGVMYNMLAHRLQCIHRTLHVLSCLTCFQFSQEVTARLQNVHGLEGGGGAMG